MAGPIRIAVLANAAQARRELGTIETTASRLQTNFSKLKIPAAAALGAIGLGAKNAIGAASDLAETQNKSSIIFGKNAGDMDKWASGAAKNMGLSKQAALETASGFGDMFSQLGFAGDQAATMSKGVVGLSADLGSFNNLPTEDVSQRIAAAFRGEYDSLQQLIPNINAARVEREAMAATGKKSAADLTAQEKATATLAIVQKDGARAQGDFARTSAGAANSAKIAAASAQDLSANLGTALLPAYTAVLQKVVGFVAALNEHQGAVKVVVGVVAGLAAAVLAVSAAQTIANTVMAITRGVMIAYTAVQWALNAAMAANPIGLIVLAIVALVAVLVLAYKKSETFRNIVNGALRGVLAAARAVWSGIKAAAVAVWSFITAYIRTQIALAKAVIRGVVAVARAVWNAIKAAASAAFRGVKVVITSVRTTAVAVWSAIKSKATAVWTAIKTAVSNAISSAKTKLGELRTKAAEIVTRIKSVFSPGALLSAGRQLISGLVQGIREKINTAVDAVRAGVQRIKDLLPGSPIKDGPLKSWNNGGAGKRLMALLAGGIRAGAPGVRTSMSNALDPSYSLRGLLLASGGGGAPIQITIQTGVGDPVAIGREVDRVLTAYARAGGRKR